MFEWPHLARSPCPPFADALSGHSFASLQSLHARQRSGHPGAVSHARGVAEKKRPLRGLSLKLNRCSCGVVLFLVYQGGMKILDVPQSGSVAGVTSSRNRFGQYRRTRAIPVNPNTLAQNEVRQNLATNAQEWKNLTAPQQEEWNVFAEGHPKTDTLGQTIYLTGFQWFVSVNNINRLLGVTPTTEPPVLIGQSSSPGTIGAMASTAGAITVTTTAATTLNQFLVFSSPPRSPGVNFNRDYRYLGNIPAGAAASVPLTTMVTSKWGLGPSTDGMKFFFRFVEQLDGFQFSPVDRQVIFVN